MALRAEVLQIEAEKSELKKLQLLEVTKERVLALEPLLQDIYDSRRPNPADYEIRKDLVRCFNDMAKDIFGQSNDTPVVVEFGSFVMDLFSPTSDLDLSVNFRTTTVPFPRERKLKTLKRFTKKLYYIQRKGHVSDVLPVPQAKVPILKCVDKGTGVECDISVENRDGILKSKIIHMISSIDERFKKLSFLMKNWAKAQNINSSKDRTLNSLSIILLVAFHLQTRNPPILPPFAAIFKDGTDPEMVEKSLPNFVNYGQRNKESLAELFVTLLIKLSSVEKHWSEGLCASVCSASWISRAWGSKVASMSVEDFTDQSQNVARAVGQDEVKVIYRCIELSLQHIFSFLDGQSGVNLKELLFGRDGISTSIPRGIQNLHINAVLPLVPCQAYQPAMPVDSVLTNGIISVESRPGTALGSQEQVQQAMLPESSLTKRMRTAEGSHAMSGGSWAPAPVQGQIVGQHVDSTLQQRARGWNELRAGDWERTQQAAVEGRALTMQSRAGGWVGTEQPSSSSWGGIEQPSSSGWRVNEQLSGGGWERTQQFGGRGWAGTVLPRAGDWRGTAGAGDWEVWERAQLQNSGGWRETPQPGREGRGGTLHHTARGGGRSSDFIRRRL